MNQSDQTTQPEPIEEDITPPEPAPQPIPQPESKVSRFLKSAIRWVVGLLIVFGLGVLTIVFTLYIPNQQALQQSQADLQTANQNISDLEAQVAQMAILEAENAALQDEIDKATIHIKLLTTLSNVNTARVAVSEKDPATAKAALINTSAAIQEVDTLSGGKQNELVKSILDRLDLVMDEIETDEVAAQSDLTLLAGKILELEEALFSQ